PKPAGRLFVEGYFARGLVASHDVLNFEGAKPADRALADSALARAFAYTDSVVHHQDARGYWHIGYSSGWIADMGAAVAISAALEPHATEAQLAQYEAAAARFQRAIEKDMLVLRTGAIGVGWPTGDRDSTAKRAWRSDVGWSDDPYIVSTALAGIESNAWLFHRTHQPGYEARARRAFDYTLQ